MNIKIFLKLFAIFLCATMLLLIMKMAKKLMLLILMSKHWSKGPAPVDLNIEKVLEEISG
jgi:hypothetical protein